MEPKYVTYKQYSGYMIRGADPISLNPDQRKLHIYRALQLTCMVEAPYWGTVQSYDGAGMSAGLLHNIAIGPRTLQQGDLFALLRNMERVYDTPMLFTLIHRRDWLLGEDGKLRWRSDGSEVKGGDIREEFTGPNGVAAQRGEEAERPKRWIKAFNELFADGRYYDVQMQFAAEWLLRGYEALEDSAYAVLTKDRGVYQYKRSRDAAHADEDKLTEEVDLAMCVYHNFSVNAPAKAKSVLQRLLPDKLTPARLVRALGTTKYGRWADTPDNKRSRYDATRIAAGKLGYWSPDIVRKLMPINFS